MTTQTLTYRFTLDTFRNGVQRILQGFQTGEEVARKMEISLVSGSDSYLIPLSNVVASMYVMRPSQTEPSINACEIESNKIIYEIQPEDISEAGTVNLQLKLISTINGTEETIISPMFAMEVWESQIEDSEAEGTTTYTALTTALAEAERVSKSAITEFVIDEDNLIIVTFGDGTIYTSTVIQNALAEISSVTEYAVRAETAAALAGEASVSARLSASIASTSEDNAKESEEKAKASEDTVKGAEANALAYARDASASALSAVSAVSSAQSYANDALGYKDLAASSELNASNSESNAETYMNNASASASNASASATNASSSEQNAYAFEQNASSYATLSQSYAVGNTGSRAGEEDDNAKHYKEVCEQIAASLEGGFIPMGTVAFENLPTALVPGWMYNISNEFTSDSRFKDGGGKKYASGTNVYVTADLMWDCMSGAVPTINGKNGNVITLDGSDILVTGYSKASSESVIAVSDDINTALGKLEKRADLNKSLANTKVAKTDVVDNLTSTDTDKPLSAKQGKTLNDMLGGKSIVVTTRTAYDAMASHDANTIYFFTAEE